MGDSRAVAVALLDSLLTRLEARPRHASLTVEITPQEVEALRALVRSEKSNSGAPTGQRDDVPDADKPSIDWSKYAAKPVKSHRLCIDFGTAFSKVCLVGAHDREIKPLKV